MTEKEKGKGLLSEKERGKGLLSESMTTVFIEQPLALPGSAKYLAL